jgi:hypothetical protein
VKAPVIHAGFKTHIVNILVIFNAGADSPVIRTQKHSKRLLAALKAKGNEWITLQKARDLNDENYRNPEFLPDFHTDPLEIESTYEP